MTIHVAEAGAADAPVHDRERWVGVGSQDIDSHTAGRASASAGLLGDGAPSRRGLRIVAP